jgi:NAD(P)-dependent dehydrogenase (short-subunit alcohol dehydrogenase family)
MTEEQFDRVFSLNVKVPSFLVAELAPLMAKRGKGAIVNLSTMLQIMARLERVCTVRVRPPSIC